MNGTSGFLVSIEGADQDYVCAPGDTVLRAALRAGVALPYECNSGGCGSCKFELVSGSLLDRWQDAPGVSPRDAKRGRKLACQCEPVEDIVIKTNVGQSADALTAPRQTTVTYEGRRDLTDDMSEFEFVGCQPAEFRPGQFALLKLPQIVGERAYSMSNLPNAEGRWHFIVKRMPAGKGSNWLFDELQVGHAIELDGPFGHAYLREHSTRDIVCIAGGSGLSPIMSILRKMSDGTSNSARRVHLFFGGRTPDDICTPELVAELPRSHIELTSYEAISDELSTSSEDWSGHRGFIHEVVASEMGPGIADCEVYFCGPPPMTEAVQRMLMMDHKVPFEQIHFDRFF